jgi:hypothetical protein
LACVTNGKTVVLSYFDPRAEAGSAKTGAFLMRYFWRTFARLITLFDEASLANISCGANSRIL